MGNTILIAEDDKHYLAVLEKCFKSAGFTVYTAGTCRDTCKLAFELYPDCFLFDYHLEDDSVLLACLAIRDDVRLKTAPLVILSGDGTREDISYNNCKADLFLTKGTSPIKIMAAVRRHILRAGRAKRAPGNSDLTCDPRSMTVLKFGQPLVCLPPEQFRLFAVLSGRPSQFVSERQLCTFVFRGDPADRRGAITALVYRLRRSLGARYGRRIKNKKNLGWVYVRPRVRS